MRKSIQIACVALALAGIIGAGSWFIGRPAYRKHKEVRAAAGAKEYLAKGDYANASLSARQALLINSTNLDACRIMAELCQISRAPQLLDWRRRIAEAAPTSENRILLASAALRTQGPPYPLAVETLENLQEAAKGSADYHVVCAELALKTKRPGLAAEHFALAAKLEPANPQHQLNLSVLRLQSTNTAEAAGARVTLESLGRSTNLGVVALRWLVADRVEREDWPKAKEYSNELNARPGSNIDDRLQHLSILKSSKERDFELNLQNLQEASATNVGAIYTISTWMIAQGLVDQAIQWITNTPARIQSAQPVAVALVDCYIAKQNWKQLRAFLQTGEWGEQEFLRLAFLSRATAELRDTMGAEELWRAAVRAAGGRLGPLSSLLAMATSWGQQEARTDLLWQIAQKFPRERWAYSELDRTYQAAKNTRGLNRVYAAMMSSQPDNLLVKNNFATTSFLLKQSLPTAHDVAREIYKQHPENPVICSTYAYSLLLQGRTREAVDLVSKFSEKDKEDPAFSVYFAAVFLQDGQTNQAAHCLALAAKADLLPEEKALAEEMRKSL